MLGVLRTGASLPGGAAEAETPERNAICRRMDMDTHVLTAENDQLKRCLDSLSGILAARDAVKDRAPAAIVETLLDSLLAGLDLHIVYLQLLRPVDGMPAEMLKTAKLKGTSVQAVEIGPR